jgi:hypothetical protein
MPNVVVVLDSFVFDKTKGILVKQSHKKLKLLGFPKLTGIVKTLLMANPRTIPIATTFAGVIFPKI